MEELGSISLSNMAAHCEQYSAYRVIPYPACYDEVDRAMC